MDTILPLSSDQMRERLQALGKDADGERKELITKMVLCTMTVAQVKDELRTRKLPVAGGKKKVLVERLVEDLDPPALMQRILELSTDSLRRELSEREISDIGERGELLRRLVNASLTLIQVRKELRWRKVPFKGRRKLALVDELVHAAELEAANQEMMKEAAESYREDDDVIAERPEVDVSGFGDVDSKEWFDGVVRNVMSFGAFVEVQRGEGPSQWGILPAWELPEEMFTLSSPRPNARVRNAMPKGKLTIGQALRVRVRHVDLQGEKLGLTAREIDDESEEEVKAKSDENTEAVAEVLH